MKHALTYWFGLTAVAAAFAMAGCAPDATWRESTGGFLGFSVTPKEQWSAGGDVTDAMLAIDQNLASAAATGPDYTGQFIVIDLGKACTFQTIIIDHGDSQNGYAETIEVATSMDARQFISEYTQSGTRRVTVISMPKTVLTRYVRLRAVRPGAQPWSLAEVYFQ